MDGIKQNIDIDWSALQKCLEGITFSETETARIRKVGKAKVVQMLGTQIKCVQKSGGNGRIACDAWSVLQPIIEQCVLMSV